MTKKRILLFVFAVIIISGCTQQASQQQSEFPTNEQETPETLPEPIAEERIEEQILPEPEPPKEVQPTPTEQFQIFNPTLTYEGAYNGPLYGTSEQVGTASMDSYFENLDRNGINFFIGMFGIEGEPRIDLLVSDQGLGEVIAAAKKHPSRIIPFFNPGIGGEEIEANGYLQTDLDTWYINTLSATQQIMGNDFIRGFGEIETQEWRVRHNDPNIMALIELADKNNIAVMFHPVASKISDVKEIIEAYPNTTFLIHMYREDLENSKTELITLLQEHDNLYFSIDAAHIIHITGDVIYDFDSANTQSSIQRFVSYYDSYEQTFVANAIKAYKPLVDAAPDKVMWGTEIGPKYAFDPAVFDRAIKVSRMVIAGFDPQHQEGVGYKNALQVFGQGVVVNPSISVLDTSSWPTCTDAQMVECDDSCNVPDTDGPISNVVAACYLQCIIDQKCQDNPSADVG